MSGFELSPLDSGHYNLADESGCRDPCKRTCSLDNFNSAKSTAIQRFQRTFDVRRIGIEGNLGSFGVNFTTKGVSHHPQSEGSPGHVGKRDILDGWQRLVHTEGHQLEEDVSQATRAW